MQKSNGTLIKNRILVANGTNQADLVLKNANVVDIFCHRIIQCDVAIYDGIIVGMGKYDSTNTVDCTGKYVMPSFYDTHIHFESSMATPTEYLYTVVPHGVTSINADCHEIANVCGEDGIQYMIDCTKDAPININHMLPSCVPATSFERGNAIITANDTQRLMKTGQFFGLGEMMNYPGVINADKEVMDKLSTTTTIDGHSPSLVGNELNAYLCGGMRTDHECETIEEVKEKISKGMYVMIREGSLTKNLTTLIKAIDNFTKRRMIFCTDDRYIGEVLEGGTIQRNVLLAVERGVDIYDALAIASINAYECYNIRNKGAIAIGYSADLIIADDILPNNILQVYCNGKLVADNGKATFTLPQVDNSKVTNTVHIKKIFPQDLDVPFTPNTTPIIKVLPHAVVTKKVYADSTKGLNMCAVIDRHNATGDMGKCWVADFNLKGGAIAQTIGHDSHNITVIGDNTADMALAVNSLGNSGGMIVVMNGRVMAHYDLDIAGLMSSLPALQSVQQHNEILRYVEMLDTNKDVSSFMLLSFLSLIVIPDIKICDKGLFDVTTFSFIEQ